LCFVIIIPVKKKKEKFNLSNKDYSFSMEEIKIPIYKCSVLIVRGKEADRYFKATKIDERKMNASTTNYMDHDGTVVIAFVSQLPKLSTVVHELTHATQFIMNGLGHDYKKSKEPFAYLVSWLVEEFYKK